jgi:sterol desaturase/sphingolipid hydroxylase (fatty acid hydroxylase superfamily)
MKTRSFSDYWKSKTFSEVQCHIIFLFLFSPLIYSTILLENGIRSFFHLGVFAAGFILFTYLEYIAHRFWMHGKEDKRPGKSPDHHMNHHRHPTEIKITSRMRTKLLLGNFILIATAIFLDNYFTFFSGFYTGFVYYCFMHVFLHTPFAKKVFPNLQVSHIHHHCKFPDRCFSTCLIWWDKLFNTSVPKAVKISDKIIQFYFGKSGH